MQGMDESHAGTIRSFSRHQGMIFRWTDFADYLNKSLSQLKQLREPWASSSLRCQHRHEAFEPRLHDYLAASVSKIDYDVISFPSAPNRPLEMRSLTFEITT